MKINSGVLGLVASLVLLVGFTFAQTSGQQSDTSMQQSESQQQMSMQGSAMTQDADMVKKVQQALSDKGYNPGPTDGKWGSKTQGALKKFQQEQGIQATGQLDQQTLAALGVEGGAAAGGQESMGDQQKQESMEQQSGAGGQESMEDQQKQEGMDQQSGQTSDQPSSGSKY